MADPDYRRQFSAAQIERGDHRKHVGGLWDEIGRLQLDFLVEQGLTPEQRFLDVACGALRAGIHFVDYLDAGNYYGIDINGDLLDAGYDIELPEHLREKLPRSQLQVAERFECDFGVSFDFAIAQSLFTHVPLNSIRLCMYRVAQQMRPGGRLFVTFNEFPRSFPVDGVKGRLHGDRNVYWYYRSDMRWAASFSPWRFRYIGDWGHPRGQRMVELTRLEDDAPARRQRKQATRRGRYLGRRTRD
jgi:SAM-dependent methyltransferase